MNKNDLPFYLRKAIQKVFNNLGPGLFGSVYAQAVCAELADMGLNYRNDPKLPAGTSLERGKNLNILVEEKIRIGIGDFHWSLELHHP